MNKLEEKFKEATKQYYENYDVDAYYKQCAEITEQECIGFAEWKDKNYFFSDVDFSFILNGEKCKEKTLPELFQLYLKSKENESK